MGDNGQALSIDMVKDIYSGLARMEAKLDSIGDVRDIAIEAMQSTKSAHNRIDGEEKNRDEAVKGLQKQVDNLRGILSGIAVSVILAIVGGGIAALWNAAN